MKKVKWLVFIFVLLSALIVIRFLPIGEDNTFIKSVGYIGVLFSLVDLYVEAFFIWNGLIAQTPMKWSF